MDNSMQPFDFDTGEELSQFHIIAQFIIMDFDRVPLFVQLLEGISLLQRRVSE